MFDAMGSIFPVLFSAIVLVVIFLIIKNIKQQIDNANAPLTSVFATVVDKRMSTIHNNYPNAGDASGAHGYTVTTNTVRYVTFETENGDRSEFSVDSYEYDSLSEGDTGRLSFKGTKFISFERTE